MSTNTYFNGVKLGNTGAVIIPQISVKIGEITKTVISTAIKKQQLITWACYRTITKLLQSQT